MMKAMTGGLVIVALIISAHLAAAETRLPPFLPDYYAPVFDNGGYPLLFLSQKEVNGATQFSYSTADNQAALNVWTAGCERPECDALYGNRLRSLNQLIASNQGSFVEISSTEVNARLALKNAAQSIFVFVLPNSVQTWIYTRTAAARATGGLRFGDLRDLVDRQRYEQALAAGNVSMGQWEKNIHGYADQLFRAGKKDEALAVLKNLLATSPFDYQAHLELMENTADSASASNSAGIVLKGAEGADQISEAAKFLGDKPKTLEEIAPLGTNETGLQVMLVPLAPCNPWLLEDVARVYQQITDIPVKIRRLDEQWRWAAPDRIARQREIRGWLVQMNHQNIDFNNWSKDRYVDALSDAMKSQDALTQYWIQDAIRKIEKEPGQYLVDPYLDRLCSTLEGYRSKDVRTMYVAITEANIYSGDNNFVFSLGRTGVASPASLLSYYMMLGKTLGATYESRRRLVERIAKELVPASLKQLGIPRSTDPTCPYSYSSGLDRLDQKTLTLSDAVKQALNKFRDPATKSTAP